MLYCTSPLTGKSSRNNRNSDGTPETSEALLIPESDLAALRSFNSHGSITVSAFLRLDTPEHREAAYGEFVQQIQARLEECGRDESCRKAIEEDVEIVEIYLNTNGHRDHAGLAIFSCAAELFWRAFPLDVPIASQVVVGPSFDLSPLLGGTE
jgi:hypothetical protein